MQSIGVIPARGGSKGVPRKNIRLIDGIPLIAYSIEAALNSRILDRVIVSTDDQEIADIAMYYGAEVPFLRPAEFATDNASDLQVLTHLVSQLVLQDNITLAYLRPTTPFKTGSLIDDVLTTLCSNTELSGVRSVTRSEGVFHPYWMFQNEGTRLTPFVDGINLEKYYQRQLLPPCLRLNGVCDALRVSNLKRDSIYGSSIGFVEVDEQKALDIDTENDLLYFEFLLSRQKNKRFNNGVSATD